MEKNTTMLLADSRTSVTDSRSPIGLTGDAGDWHRHLTIDGENAFYLGVNCETCSFFFERLDGANKKISSKETVEKLNDGLEDLDNSTVDALKRLLPDGNYKILLQIIEPTLAEPGQLGDYFSEEQAIVWSQRETQDPKTNYYRLKTTQISSESGLFEFLIPTYPERWLSSRQILRYESELELGRCPTAVSISTLDVRQSACWEDDVSITEHWCLAHYLIDGHHKAFAASQVNRPITLLSFLAINGGIAPITSINSLVEYLKDYKTQ